MKRFFLLAALVGAMTITSGCVGGPSAPTTQVKGKVTCGSLGLQATVTVGTSVFHTAADGSFQGAVVAPGVFTIQASAPVGSASAQVTVVEGQTVTVNLAVPVPTPFDANEFKELALNNNGIRHFNTRDLKVFYDATVQPALKAASQPWMNQLTALGFTFTEVTSATGADLIVQEPDFIDGAAGDCTIAYNPDGSSKTATIRVAVPYANNPKFAGHELGHAYGLAHSVTNQNYVMCPYNLNARSYSQQELNYLRLVWSLAPGTTFSTFSVQ